MRVGILGGSFDPVHRGHLKLGLAALRQLRLSRVYFVVSPRSPFKLKRRLAPAQTRLAMVRTAVAGEPKFTAAGWELTRPGPSYTISTLRSYRRRHPHQKIFVILGTDALRTFARWRQPLSILKLATLAVGRRPGTPWPKVPDWLEGHVIRLRGVFPDVSSTAIRRRAAKGGRLTDVPAPAARFIRAGKYYR